ncbi:Uncharacterised protein g9225 [Pycnogonum litorale]
MYNLHSYKIGKVYLKCCCPFKSCVLVNCHLVRTICNSCHLHYETQKSDAFSQLEFEDSLSSHRPNERSHEVDGSIRFENARSDGGKLFIHKQDNDSHQDLVRLSANGSDNFERSSGDTVVIQHFESSNKDVQNDDSTDVVRRKNSHSDDVVLIRKHINSPLQHKTFISNFCSFDSIGKKKMFDLSSVYLHLYQYFYCTYDVHIGFHWLREKYHTYKLKRNKAEMKLYHGFLIQ